jgi:hypothetical protein
MKIKRKRGYATGVRVRGRERERKDEGSSGK